MLFSCILYFVNFRPVMLIHHPSVHLPIVFSLSMGSIMFNAYGILPSGDFCLEVNMS